MEGRVLMVYVPGKLPMVSKELGKAHFKVMISLAAAAEGGGIVTSGFGGLRDDFGLVVGRAGLLALRADRGSVVLGREGPLQCVLLMTLVIGSLNWAVFAFMVFFKLLWGKLLWEGRV